MVHAGWSHCPVVFVSLHHVISSSLSSIQCSWREGEHHLDDCDTGWFFLCVCCGGIQSNLLLLLLSCRSCCKIDFSLSWTTMQRQASRQTGWLAPHKGRQAPRSHLIRKIKGALHWECMGEDKHHNRPESLKLAERRALLQLKDYSERWMEINRFKIDWTVRQWSIYTVNEMSGGLGGSDEGS